MSRVSPSLLGILGALTAATPAHAGSVWGGLVPSKTQVVVIMGYPELHLGVQVPLRRINLEGYAALSYRGVDIIDAFDLELGASGRWQVFTDGPLHGAFLFDGGFRFQPTAGGAPGLNLLQPGFTTTWEFAPIWDLDAAARITDTLFFEEDGVFGEVGFEVSAGVEVHPMQAFSVGFRTFLNPRWQIRGSEEQPFRMYAGMLVAIAFAFQPDAP